MGQRISEQDRPEDEVHHHARPHPAPRSISILSSINADFNWNTDTIKIGK